jgi:hypothetical protein
MMLPRHNQLPEKVSRMRHSVAGGAAAIAAQQA